MAAIFTLVVLNLFKEIYNIYSHFYHLSTLNIVLLLLINDLAAQGAMASATMILFNIFRNSAILAPEGSLLKAGFRLFIHITVTS